MKENKSVGPNLKTYYYYTNNMAEQTLVKGIIVLATGMEGSGLLYDEIGEYLDNKGYALYAIDELGYGKTGEVNKKTGYKNWKRKDAHFAAYNIHALSVLAKSRHDNAPVYLIGNDFGAMLSLYLIKEFPEVIDKVVTIGWGAIRLQDCGFLLTSWIKKLFLYDDGKSKISHFSKNKRYLLRFERGEKYAWLTSDFDQLEKIKNAGYLDTEGTVGHYYHYFKFKCKVPCFMRLKKCDKNTPLLFVSGNEDLSTKKGRKTRQLERIYKLKRFTNVSSLIVSGRHQLLFETNRFEILDDILAWLNDGVETIALNDKAEKIVVKKEVQPVDQFDEVVESVEAENQQSIIDVEVENKEVYALQEAEDDLLISTDKNDK